MIPQTGLTATPLRGRRGADDAATRRSGERGDDHTQRTVGT